MLTLILAGLLAQPTPQGFTPTWPAPQSPPLATRSAPAPAEVVVREIETPITPYALEDWPVPRLQWPFRSPLRIERRLVLRPAPRLVEAAPIQETPRFRRSYQYDLVEPLARALIAAPSKDLPPLPSPRKSPGDDDQTDRTVRFLERLEARLGDLDEELQGLGDRLETLERRKDSRPDGSPPAAAEPPPLTPRATPKHTGRAAALAGQ